jgi:hypothetical protein
MFQEMSIEGQNTVNDLANRPASCLTEIPNSGSSPAPSTPNCLDDRSTVIRRRMIQQLYRRLERFPQQPNLTSIQKQREATYRAAQVLEDQLYKQSSSLLDYQDWDIIKERLRSILARRLCQLSLHPKETSKTAVSTNRKNSTNKDDHHQGTISGQTPSALSSHHLQPETSSPNDRSTVLKTLLGGQDKYQEIRSLVQAIQTVKLQQVVSLRGCYSSGIGIACRTTSSITSHPPVQTAFSGQFPPEIKQLFFHTPLVDAFERTPVYKLASLNWTLMVQQALRNLQAFHQFNCSLPV